MTDDLGPTLQKFAKQLPGCDWQQIHKDLERLGFLHRKLNCKSWSITKDGAGGFAYHEYEDGHNATVRPNELGKELILLLFEAGELTMKPLYSEWNGHRRYHPGRVVLLALQYPDRVNYLDQRLLDRLDPKDGFKIPGIENYAQHVQIQHAIDRLGAKLYGVPLTA